MQILKKNEFKTVTLHDSCERWLVEKSFTAFSKEQQLVNAQYLYDALVWFYQEFRSIISVPEPVKIDFDSSSVFMTYLDDLPNAAYISSRSIHKAMLFFEHCYKYCDDQGFLRDLQGSVAVTPSSQTLLDSDFPLSLGFKGDLFENLVIGPESVILADIDSIALEPLGLSELALYAGLACSFSPRTLLSGLLFPLPIPVAYKHLDKKQAEAINMAAVEMIFITMRDLSPRSRSFKIWRATSALERLKQRYFVNAK